MVPMDARLIEQVVTNLLENAVKHTNEEKAIQANRCKTKRTNRIRCANCAEMLAENGFELLPTWQDALSRYLKEIEE